MGEWNGYLIASIGNSCPLIPPAGWMKGLSAGNLCVNSILCTVKQVNFVGHLISHISWKGKIRKINLPQNCKFYVDIKGKLSIFTKLSACKNGAIIPNSQKRCHKIILFYSILLQCVFYSHVYLCTVHVVYVIFWRCAVLWCFFFSFFFNPPPPQFVILDNSKPVLNEALCKWTLCIFGL